MLDAVLNASAFIAAFVAMEGVAWAVHRYVMHGPLWILHRSHHAPRAGGMEANDLFGLLFAAVAIALFCVGADQRWSPLWWAAAGITVYGALYALVHDALAHRRWGLPVRARGRYLRGLVQAHRLHHMTRTRTGAVSFGFLAPRNVSRLAAELRARSGRA